MEHSSSWIVRHSLKILFSGIIGLWTMFGAARITLAVRGGVSVDALFVGFSVLMCVLVMGVVCDVRGVRTYLVHASKGWCVYDVLTVLWIVFAVVICQAAIQSLLPVLLWMAFASATALAVSWFPLVHLYDKEGHYRYMGERDFLLYRAPQWARVCARNLLWMIVGNALLLMPWLREAWLEQSWSEPIGSMGFGTVSVGLLLLAAVRYRQTYLHMKPLYDE